MGDDDYNGDDDSDNRRSGTFMRGDMYHRSYLAFSVQGSGGQTAKKLVFDKRISKLGKMSAKLFGCLDVAEPNHQVPTKPGVLPDFPYSSSSPLFDLK